MEEKLLLLLFAAQEGIALVQLPVGKPHTGQAVFKYSETLSINVSSADQNHVSRERSPSE